MKSNIAIIPVSVYVFVLQQEKQPLISPKGVAVHRDRIWNKLIK